MRYLLCRFLCLVIGMACLSEVRAAEIQSKVVEVQSDQVKVARDTKLDPKPGDKATIYAEIPGLDDLASVASGKVSEISGEVIVLKIDKTTGKVAKGQLVKITSDSPVARKVDKPNEPARVPDDIHVSKDLRVGGWMTFRRLTHFQGDDKIAIRHARLSGDGSRVIFTCDKGTYVMSADPAAKDNKPVRLGGAVNGPGDAPESFAISADGSTVVWLDSDGLFVAKSDGSGKKKLKLDVTVNALCLDGAGKKIFLISQQGGALMMLTTASEEAKKLVTTAQMAKPLGFEPGDLDWLSALNSLGVSDDGQHIAFRFGFLQQNIFTVNGDGTDLRKLTSYDGKEKRAVIPNVAISGDGKTVAFFVDQGKDEDTLRFFSWDGREISMHPKVRGGFMRVQVSRDGSEAAVGKQWGLDLCKSDGGRRQPLQLGISVGARYSPIAASAEPSLSADFHRACFIIPVENINQLVILDFNPRTIEGVPALRDVKISPRVLPPDGTKSADVTATIDSPNLAAAGFTVLRDGVRGDTPPSAPDLALELNTKADPPEQGKVYSSQALRLKGVSPGPVTVRVFAYTKDGSILAVDVEGIEGREPGKDEGSGSTGGSGAIVKNDELFKRAIEEINNLIDVLQCVKDSDSAKEAAVKINAIADRLEDISKVVRALSESEQQRMRKKFEAEITQVSSREHEAKLQADKNSGGEGDYIRATQRLGQFFEQPKGSNPIDPKPTEAKSIITYEDLLKLVQLKVSEEEILKSVAASPRRFVPVAEHYEELTKAGASAKLLDSIRPHKTCEDALLLVKHRVNEDAIISAWKGWSMTLDQKQEEKLLKAGASQRLVWYLNDMRKGSAPPEPRFPKGMSLSEVVGLLDDKVSEEEIMRFMATSGYEILKDDRNADVLSKHGASQKLLEALRSSEVPELKPTKDAPPLTYNDVAKLVYFKFPDEEIIKVLSHSPGQFALNKAVEEDLLNLGASETLLVAIRNLPNGSGPIDPKASGSGPAISHGDVLKLLQLKVGEDEIMKVIAASSSNDFEFDEKHLDELKKAGASERLIKAMQSAGKGSGSATKRSITYEEVLKLLELKVSEEEILRLVRESPTKFEPLTKSQEEELLKAGASEKLLTWILTRKP